MNEYRVNIRLEDDGVGVKRKWINVGSYDATEYLSLNQCLFRTKDIRECCLVIEWGTWLGCVNHIQHHEWRPAAIFIVFLRCYWVHFSSGGMRGVGHWLHSSQDGWMESTCLMIRILCIFVYFSWWCVTPLTREDAYIAGSMNGGQCPGRRVWMGSRSAGCPLMYLPTSHLMCLEIHRSQKSDQDAGNVKSHIRQVKTRSLSERRTFWDRPIKQMTKISQTWLGKKNY